MAANQSYETNSSTFDLGMGLFFLDGKTHDEVLNNVSNYFNIQFKMNHFYQTTDDSGTVTTHRNLTILEKKTCETTNFNN